jgi:hypothetical protein
VVDGGIGWKRQVWNELPYKRGTGWAVGNLTRGKRRADWTLDGGALIATLGVRYSSGERPSMRANRQARVWRTALASMAAAQSGSGAVWFQ